MSAPEDLERRLQAMEDAEAIKAVKAAYWRAVDLKSPVAAVACLTEDVTVDFEGVPRCEGREAVRALLEAGAARPAAYDMHHGSNPEIFADGGDTATGRWTINYRGLDAAARLIIRMAGEYEDTYVRLADGWRIRAMTMRQTSFAMFQVDEAGRERALSLGQQTAAAFGVE